jgi:hypothetical protein
MEKITDIMNWMLLYKTVLIALFAIVASIANAHPIDTLKVNHSTPDSLRVILPVTISYDNNEATPFVNVTVNHKQFKAIFDTGSNGLRIMSGALNIPTPDSTARRISYTYGEKPHNLNLRKCLQG